MDFQALIMNFTATFGLTKRLTKVLKSFSSASIQSLAGIFLFNMFDLVYHHFLSSHDETRPALIFTLTTLRQGTS